MSEFDDIYALFPSADTPTRTVLTRIYLVVEFLAYKCLTIDFYISIFGVFVTVFHLIILTRKPMMTSSVMSVLIGIAICDLLSMSSSIATRDVILRIEGRACIPPISLLAYRIFWCFLSLRDDVIRCSTWLSVFMALIRYYVLKFVNTPSSQRISGFPFGFYAFGTSFTVSSFFSFGYFTRSKIVQVREWNPAEHCTELSEIAPQPVYETQPSDFFAAHDGAMHRVFMFTNGIVSKILPCILLPVLTTLLIVQLRRAKKHRKMSRVADKNTTERTTGVVIFMTVSSFIALLPTGMMTSLQAVYTDFGFLYASTYVDHICYTVLTINASIHGLVCFTMSSLW